MGLDPAATIDATAAGLMLTLLFDLFGFTAKPDALSEPTDVTAGDWALSANTPVGTEVTGSITLNDLRRVFPGS